MTLRCYCCGATIPPSQAFALISMGDNVDRVFVFLRTHMARAEGFAMVVSRRRLPKT